MCACATPHSQYTKIAMENRENLFQLKTGMDKKEVLKVMGENRKTIRYPGLLWMYGIITAGHVNNPYKTEFLTIDDKQYEVIYYYTDVKTKGRQRTIADDELTPLIFEGGKLIGWGWSFLKVKIPTYEIRIR